MTGLFVMVCKTCGQEMQAHDLESIEFIEEAHHEIVDHDANTWITSEEIHA